MTSTAAWTRGRRAIGVILGVLLAAAAAEPHHHHHGRLADLAPEVLQALPQDVARAEQEQDCAADVAGASVMVARCRATCLDKFAAPSEEGGSDCTSRSDACLMCWDHCGQLKRGPETLASICKDENLCWLGCRAACDFYFPYGLGTDPEGVRWNLRPTKEASAATAVHALPPPRFDADGLTLRWRQPMHQDDAGNASIATSAAAAVTTVTDASTTTTSTAAPVSASEDGAALDATVEDVSKESADADADADASSAEQDSPSPPSQARPSHKHVVFVVSARMAPSLAWRELKQTVDNWLELSETLRSPMRAVSVLAVSAEGPVARASACVAPLTSAQRQPDASLEDADYYDEDNSSDENDEHDDDSGSAVVASSDNSLRRLSFDQLRGTVQNGVLLRALLKDRTTAKHLVEDAAQEDEADEADDEDDEGDEDVLLDRRRLDLVKRLLGAGHGRGRGNGGRGRGDKAPAAAGWGLHLVGVWAAGGGARLPRARVSWTAPRGVAETLVNWAVPALRISGSRVVSGVSEAEVPLVEQHATRVTVGDAHSSDVSPALVLQLSVHTDSSVTGGAETVAVEAPGLASPAVEQVAAASVPPRTPSYERAALWEATLVAVGLVVGAAALCVALFLAAYGVHSRVARCCRGRGHGIHAGMSGIHAKSASVEPLNAPDQNNV